MAGATPRRGGRCPYRSPYAYQDEWHRSACPRCRQAVALVLFEDSTRLRTYDDARQHCRCQLRICEWSGVSPIKDVIAPAPLLAPSSRHLRTLRSRHLQPLEEARGRRTLANKTTACNLLELPAGHLSRKKFRCRNGINIHLLEVPCPPWEITRTSLNRRQNQIDVRGGGIKAV